MPELMASLSVVQLVALKEQEEGPARSVTPLLRSCFCSGTPTLGPMSSWGRGEGHPAAGLEPIKRGSHGEVFQVSSLWP